MAGLNDVIERLSQGTQNVLTVHLGARITKVRDYLNALDEIRVFTANSQNFGHQSSSVNILRNLIRMGAPGPYTFALSASNSADYADLEEKIRLLIPQFRQVGVTFELGAGGRTADVTVVRLDKALAPAQFAISGGFDDLENKTPPYHLLNVTNYVQLQPYAWNRGTNMVRIKPPGGTASEYNLDELNPTTLLARRAFYLADPELTQSDREAIAQTPYANKARVIERLLERREAGEITLFPVYGVTTKGSAYTSLYNAVTGALIAQNTHPAVKKTVMVQITTLTASEWEAFLFLMRDPAGQMVNKIRTTPDFRGWNEENKVKDRVQDLGSPNSVPTVEQLDEELSYLEDDQLLVVYIGKIPAPLFDALYASATLPPVLEGQNTAELMLNLGKPYFKITSNNSREADARFSYATLPLSSTGAGTDATNSLDESFNGIYFTRPDKWYRDRPTYPPTQLPAMINAYVQPTGNARATYFAAQRTFFHDELNDKLLRGLDLFVNLIGPAALEEHRLALAHAELDDANAPVHEAGAAARAPARIAHRKPPTRVAGGDANGASELLEAFYEDLTSHTVDGVLDFLLAVTDGILNEFFRQVVIDVVFTITDTVTEINADKTEVTLTGKSKAFGAGNLTLAFSFTDSGGTIAGKMSGAFTDTVWAFPGAQWLSVANPSLALAIDSNAAVPVTGTVGATFTAGIAAKASLTLPSEPGRLLLQAEFLAPRPSITNIFQMLGGINIQALLPSQIQFFSDIEVQNLALRYSYANGVMEYIGVTLGTPENRSWQLVPGVTVTGLSFSALTDYPGDLQRRSTRYVIGGRFDIAGGHAQLEARVPALRVTGGLIDGSPPITLAAIVTEYLGADFAAAIPASVSSTAIEQLSFMVDQAQGAYSFSMDVSAQWPVPSAANALFTITGLNFAIDAVSRDINPPKADAGGNNGAGGTQTEIEGSFGGSLIVLPNSESPIGLSTTATYKTAAKAWTFDAQQTSGVVSLGALLVYYLGNTWQAPQGQEYAIDGLGLTITSSPTDSTWAFTGKTADNWVVPFLDVSLAAKLRMGDAGAKAEVPGKFGRLDLEVIWQNIDLTVWFDYNPKVKQYGITWGLLEGVVDGPDPTTQDWTATLGFKQNTTLGSMIETMVSWATGSKFGLESPWSFLNAIPLSNLALKYTFNQTTPSRNKVSFAVTIGPINLGFARIDSIDVGYQSTGEDRGVMVTLNGSFFWQSDPSTPLEWDASKPGTAPAPPGNGNKYLDLRLLAMGQHITLPCFATADTVQKAIACMATLPDPKPGQIPAVRFDAQSAWLIGTDFGVLKIDSGQTGNNANALRVTNDGNSLAESSGYVLTLQAVFNDPHLYGLRIALDGAAAKVFKGLDFQIMYRQVSDTVGVYQAEITLPDLMRHLTVGAYSLTLPVFGIAVYTNGDFQVDIGFPWNENFSRSFTIEAIIPPGIPVLGSAGFYFGKLSSASTNRVPASSYGTFNPVLVFGFGMQVGFGKSIEYGILSAGFSVTVVGILEGILAKWNPYQLTHSGREPSTQLQGDYYFWLRGTVGIVGRVYGSVDFAIVKANVDITVKLLLQLTYESYVSITITVIASVDVSVSVKINLGLFKISISFSFSMRLKETFTIDNRGAAPWLGDGRNVRGVLRLPVEHRLSGFARAQARDSLLVSAPNWGNLRPDGVTDLSGYLVPGLTAARDEWTPQGEPANQLSCWVALLLIESVPPAGQDAGASKLKAAGSAPDSSFEALAKMVLRWAIAAVQGPMTPDEVDRCPVPATLLDWLADDVLVSTGDDPTPIPLDAVQAFLDTHFRFNLRVPPTDQDASADTAYFPAPPQLRVMIPPYGNDYPGVQYTLGSYNALGENTLAELRAWFDQLAVQVEREQAANGAAARAFVEEAPLSMAGWMFSDYFLLLARQMVKAAQDALRDFKYALDANETPDDVVSWVNTTGQLNGLYTLNDVFGANALHALVAEKTLTIGVTSSISLAKTGQTFTSLAKAFDDALPASAIASANAADAALLQSGATITYPGFDPYTSVAGDTLVSIAAHYQAKLNDLLADSDVLDAAGMLRIGASALMPYTAYTALATDTFASVAALPVYAGGFGAAALATANAGRSVLLEGVKIEYPDKDAYTVQPRDTLGDVANAFGVTVSDLLATSAVLTQPGLLAPVASLTVPAFRYTTQQGDDLAQVAARFGVAVSVLADQPANGTVAGLFDTGDTLDLPHLPQFPLAELLAEAQRSGMLQHLSGIASSYTMHGLRFPTSGPTGTGGQWSIVPNEMGMWVHDVNGTLKLPPQAGLYALTGQQFPLPALGADPFAATFDSVAGAGSSWLRFVDGNGGPTDHLTLSVTPGTPDATRIAQVTAAAKTRLVVPMDMLGAGKMYDTALATYPFTSALQWLSTHTIALPYGQPPAGVQSLRVWQLPGALAALPDPATHAVNPRFALRVARYDDATGATETTGVDSYGWASTIGFTVRRIQPVAGSPASVDTYEVVGASGAAIVVLEQLLSQVQADDSAYFGLSVGFAPDSATGGGEGVQTGGAASVVFGIAQVNLSTETRPPAGAAFAALRETAGETPQLTLLNSPSEFMRLLWEASITRSGGFFLYYYDRAAGGGLPDRIFNDRNEASLTLIVLYAKPAAVDDQDRVTNYMNAVVTTDALDTGNAVLFAEAAPVPATVTSGAGETLASLAAQWYSDEADIAEANANVALRAGALVRVSEGVYQAPPGGIALAQVASRFGTTVQALNDANPLWGGLPDPLPFPAAIRVPDLTLTAGTSAHTASLADIAGWYGEPVDALASHNARVAQLFAAGVPLVIPGGPRVRSAAVQPGVQALAALRPAPPQVDGTSPDYGTELLLNNFSLLNQQVYGNVDFRPSDPPGLPAGPTTKAPEENGNDKVRTVVPADQVEAWNFSQALPYARFAKHVPQAPRAAVALPLASASPYFGVGGILQISFAWQDYYGNVLSTPLSDPLAGDAAPYNDAPLLTGYTDPLVSLSQWPSIASNWQVLPGSGGANPRLNIELSFDPSRYQGLLQASAATQTTITVVFTDALDAASVGELSRWQLVPGTVDSASLAADGKTVTLTVPALEDDLRYTVIATDIKAQASDMRYSGQASFDWPDNPVTRSSTVQQNASQDLHVYTQLYYQLTDPAGVDLSAQSSLLADAHGAPGSVAYAPAAVDKLMDWLFGTAGAASSVYAFVLDRSKFQSVAVPPAAGLPLDVDVPPQQVNTAQIFPLWTSFTMTRAHGPVLPGLETVAGIRSASTRVAPLQDALGATGGTLGLVTFATGFEQALSTPGSVRLKVATGVDRTAPPATGAASTVWAVRVGLAAGKAISYAIADAGNPAVFAPQPASNRLISRTQVPIYDYTTGKGISSTPSRTTDFTDVDLDTWCAQVFAAVDDVLTPQFTAPMQIVGELKSADYLQSILDGKKGLATVAKLWMIPVFAGETSDPSAAREAFYQQLLVRLSAAYTTRAAVEFHANVTADVIEPAADQPPRLFGPVTRNGPVFEAATVDGQALTTVFLLFSAPMDPVTAGNIENYALSSGAGVLTATVDRGTVTLTLATDVQPGQTTVTVSNLKDATGRAVRPPLTRTVTTGSASLPASTLAFSSPKLTLQAGDTRALTYLVNAPDSVRGAGGEIVSYVELDMTYQGSQIEHQIGALPGIEDYQASTWLSFVVPDTDGPLAADLGNFAVPLVLRAFPASPAMTEQSGTPTHDLDTASLPLLKQWDYAFTYSLPFHYPQDRIYGEVEFNLRTAPTLFASFPDAFAQLAEFITVFPKVNADLQTILAGIDATVDPMTDQQKIDDASIALQSFIQLVDELVEAAGGNTQGNGERRGGTGLTFQAPARLLTGDPSLTFAFYEEEGSAEVGDTEGALVVTLVGAVPAGMGQPVVEIDPALYDAQPWQPPGDTQKAGDVFHYVYKRKAGPGPEGSYLSAANGQNIPGRTVRLPALDILQRQDAWSTVWVERNRELVPGKPSADAFVYTTPEVRFASPLYPTNDANAIIDVAAIPSGTPVKRSLQEHFDALFAYLLAGDTLPQIVAQVEVTYGYALNAALDKIVLPVLMQAPLTVDVAGTGAGTIAKMTADWTAAIETWFSTYEPTGGGTLWMDLTLMSNLTGQPMPLLRMRRLMLSIAQVVPLLPCR
ncbi:LysM domain-containing protein [Burkholderia pseudomallei]|nr:LysM domain-containing protein [Burkholderia pseudomallei]VCF11176.1 LysM domain-containing protein [Burkholderia pseudomallei]VCF12542.1 LysM domain-containing protein [Burkholderia pseudomallei]VCF13345.1 LysM domain-containing protein [Burkholderia pseudomallei]VCF47920.1 LysM domain-containing protein [Burkholderia pseudomallei]